MKWYEAKPNRCIMETATIKQVYPAAQIDIERGYLIAFLMFQGRKGSYLLKVVYPSEFPYEEPKAFIKKPRIKDALHRWLDGSLCIKGNAEPPNLSGKIIIDWSINWIKTYENWLDGIRWPDYIRGQQ
ncbi:MAG: hypothetical protein WBB67_12215 [bacterium]